MAAFSSSEERPPCGQRGAKEWQKPWQERPATVAAASKELLPQSAEPERYQSSSFE